MSPARGPAFIGIISFAAMAACNPQDARNLAQDTRSIAMHTGQAVGNGGLAAQVNTVLALRKGVDMSGIHIDAAGGTVTLGGHVRNEAEHRRVLQTVQDTRGVNSVVDNLRVQP